MQGPDVSGFPLAFLTSFFANPNQSRGRASVDMKHVHLSDPPPSRQQSSPYSIGRVNGDFRIFIASATDSMGKYYRMTTGSVSSTPPEGRAEEGRTKSRIEGRRSEGWLGSMRRGRCALWMSCFLEKGRGVVLLGRRGSDRAQVPPLYAIGEKFVEALEVHRAEWGCSGVGGRTLEDCYGTCSSIRCGSWWMDR